MARAATGGSRAVETYLRNFEGEKSRYSEILEMTLCYGVQCLARTFSLKGISCNELRAITNYDTVKSRDFYVRNAPHPIARESSCLQRRPVELRPKPSHSWRDGEVKMPDFPESLAMTQAGPRAAEASTANEQDDAALYSLPPVFDEIDFYTKLLGKQFVDLAWKTFTGRDAMQISTRQELDERFIRIDQRKVHPAIPAQDLPISTFAEFLGAYVTDCVRQAHRMTTESNSDGEGSSAAHLDGEKQSRFGDAKSGQTLMTNGQRRKGDNSAATGNTNVIDPSRGGIRRKQRPLHPQPQQRQVPHLLQQVQSKIKPDLQARRKKILRVKKTQSQRIAETLARARLAEYDAQRELQDTRLKHLGPQKMPISDITKGAAALEIVDDFIKSPLMDKFGSDCPDRGGVKLTTGITDQHLSTQRDPLKEELYGTAALDSSFLGCKSVPEPQTEPKCRFKQRRRNYNGWLGDFGPLHTKTIRPEWNEVADDAVNSEYEKGSAFEWKFEHLSERRHETVNTPEQQSNKTKTHPSFNKDKSYDDVVDDSNDLSDGLGENSDSDFQWLRDAV